MSKNNKGGSHRASENGSSDLTNSKKINFLLFNLIPILVAFTRALVRSNLNAGNTTMADYFAYHFA